MPFSTSTIKHQLAVALLSLLVAVIVVWTAGTSAAKVPDAGATTTPYVEEQNRFLLRDEIGSTSPGHDYTSPASGVAVPGGGCVEWRIVPSANVQNANNTLYGVASVAVGDAWAVGVTSDPTAGTTRALIQRWNNSQWTLFPSPITTVTNVLEDVTDITPNDVWAVGSILQGNSRQALTMHWNGSQWSVIPNPGAGSRLYAVSAVSSNDVWAVGTYYSNGYKTLTMHWNGAQWSIVPSPSPRGLDDVLFSVWALAPNDVWAVGDMDVGFEEYRTLILHWDGNSWTVIPSPNVGSNASNYLRDVVALSPNEVWAVGTYRGDPGSSLRTLAMRWNGSEWRVVYVPYLASSVLYGLTAISPDEIYAVGSFGSSINSTLTMRWNGSEWAWVRSPNVGIEGSTLFEADALAANDVWAVGYYKVSDYDYQTLIERYSPGTCSSPTPTPTSTATPTISCEVAWRTYPAPHISMSDSTLNDIVVLSPTDIWAVGTGLGRSLTVHWDGSNWNIVPSPNVGSFSNILYGVSALTPNDIWAVGSYSYGNREQTLAMRWNGSAWNVVPSPNIGSSGNTLYSVSALSVNDAWAVGSSAFTNGPVVILRWDGSNWNVVPGPDIGNAGHSLRDVLAVSANDVWAVGSRSYNSATLIIRWNGSTWNVVPSQSPSGTSGLFSITSISANDLWAVGRGGASLLALRWDGSQWNIVPTPSIYNSVLLGVAALSPNYAWAVGNRGQHDSILLKWDGQTWTEAPIPDPYTGSSRYLYGVGIVSQDNAWSVGKSNVASRSMIYHYNNPCNVATPTSQVTVTPRTTITAVPTSTITRTPAPCALTFTDVPSDNTFYANVRCLACRGIISGYADGTFRPNVQVTRGQLAKIVSNAANFTEPPGAQIFQDVPPDHTFYEWINRLTNRGHMSGYSCGSPGEPCVQNRPYFRPFANATRAQTSKIVANAVRYNDPPTGQTFEDVPPTHPFYTEIQRLASRNIMGGYNCGSPGEPCILPLNRPYFRPYNDVTRGQSAKIVANTFYPNCQTP